MRMANIDGSLRQITLVKHAGGVVIEAGCFFGDSSEFLARAEKEGERDYVIIVGAVVNALMNKPYDA